MVIEHKKFERLQYGHFKPTTSCRAHINTYIRVVLRIVWERGWDHSWTRQPATELYLLFNQTSDFLNIVWETRTIERVNVSGNVWGWRGGCLKCNLSANSKTDVGVYIYIILNHEARKLRVLPTNWVLKNVGYSKIISHGVNFKI